MQLQKQFAQQQLTTPIGNMIGLAYNEQLVYLSFVKDVDTKNEINGFLKKENAIASSTNSIKLFNQLQLELDAYFNKALQQFTIPLYFVGTDFQKKVWQHLLNIPYGKTISYKQQALQLNQLLGIRAIANANGKNNIAILVPCHRVIGTNGTLTGYSGGIERKKQLLEIETTTKALSLF